MFNHPYNLFVAGFIGSPQMNFFDAELRIDASGRFFVHMNDTDFPLSDNQQQALKDNGAEPQTIVLGIRPEHISLCDANDPAPHLNAVVDVCEMMGSSMHLHVNANDKDVVLVLQTVDLPVERRAGFAYGESVSFSFDPMLAHIFSAETQKNLI